jgi:DDE family transposase
MIPKIFDAARSQVPQLQNQEGLPLTPTVPVLPPRHTSDGRPIRTRQCIYTPLVTLGTFLAQILDPDHSCLQAVLRLMVFRKVRDQSVPSADTGAYCKARDALPEAFFAEAARQAGRALEDDADATWLWKGREVVLVDGTTVSMPDTAENQAEYPQARTQKPGLGFPIARLVALIALATGAVLDLAIGPYQGKETGETALFRSLLDRLRPGTVVLADCSFGSYFGLASLATRGIDALVRMHQKRKYDFGMGTL